MNVTKLGTVLSPILAFAIAIGSAKGYDLRTHGEAGGFAFLNSQGLGSYLEATGINSNDTFDVGRVTPPERLKDFNNTGTTHDWMIEGTIREDDFQRHPGLELLGCPRPQNPPSQIDRPIHHFFDVQRGGGGLTTPGVNGIPAPAWALGLQGRGPNPDQNQFSLPDARLYQLRSLTAPTREERDRNTALLFRTLGQVTHVLQDMAQHQHTRNDPHAGCVDIIGGHESFYESYLEARALGQRFRTRGEVAPPLSLGGYAAPRFTTYQNFWSTADRKGLADFSSRNFFSAGTNLSLFGNCGGLPEPPCRRDAYAQRDAPFSVRRIDGSTISGTVRLYLRSILDPLTGTTISDVPVSSRSVWDQHLEQRNFFPVFSLNTLNYDAMSDILLPRAVGYSAGLLDHFFRGKLDVDVIEDMVDPSRLNLVGTNGSPEALVDGSLTVYADDPNGVRSLVTSAGVSQLEPNAALPTLTFQAPEDAERFVAVFHGTLGQEAKDDSRNLPGAVIGKVLGGVRVEEVFSDGIRWHLRTPQGVFPLPISGQDIAELRWGDRDNTLVGRSKFGPDAPNQLFAYEIARPVGSTEIPLVSNPDGSQVVDLKVLKQALFPFGLDLRTTVNLTHTIQYKQYLMSFVHTSIFTPDVCPAPSCNYIISDRTVSEGQVTLLASESKTLTKSFPLILDRDHQQREENGTLYEWRPIGIALTATGRILVLVDVDPEPVGQVATFEAFTLAATGGADGNLQPVRTPIAPVTLDFAFPIGADDPLLWALVDVERGQVVASSAPATVTFSHTRPVNDFHSAQSGFGAARMFRKERFVGGNQNGTFRYVLSTTPWTDLFARTCPEGEEGLVSLAELSFSDAPIEFSISKYRPELEHVHFPSRFLAFDRNSLLPFLCPSRDGLSASFRLTGTGFEATPSEMRTVRGGVGPGGEQLVFLVTQEQPGEDLTERFKAHARLVVWRPERGTAEVRQEFPAADFYSLESVSSGAALVQAFDFTGFPPTFSTTLVRLEGPAAAVLFPGLRLDNFLLLDPDFLYNTSDFKFYRRQPPLQRTALPAKLAPLGSGFNPVGAYHALRLQ